MVRQLRAAPGRQRRGSHRRTQGTSTVHLFFVAPLALAIAAGRKLHVPGSLVAWERMNGPEGWRWMPILRLPGCVPLWPQPGGAERAMGLLADLFSAFERRRLLGHIDKSLLRELPTDDSTPSLWRFLEMVVDAVRKHPEHLAAIEVQLRHARPMRSLDAEQLIEELRLLVAHSRPNAATDATRGPEAPSR